MFTSLLYRSVLLWSRCLCLSSLTSLSTNQGHPEFIPDIVQKVIDNREQAGIFQADFVREARERAESEHDGVDVIAKVIWDMLVPRE